MGLRINVFYMMDSRANTSNIANGSNCILKKFNFLDKDCYRALHGFGPTKFAYGGSILGSSQFTLLYQLSLK
jgi:hypothetical protein